MRTLFAVLAVAAILAGCQTIPGLGKKGDGAGPGGTTTTAQPSAETPKPVNNELIERVKKLIDEGKLAEARDALKPAQQSTPDDPRVKDAAARLAAGFTQRAESLAVQGNLAGAQAELRQALAVDRDNPNAKRAAKQLAQTFADRGIKYRDEGKTKDAESAALSAKELDPQNVAANQLAKKIAQDYSVRAANLLDEGKEPEARANLDAAKKLDANNELANTLLYTLNADPEQELGGKYFRYTVKPGDRLSKIAEQYLNDQYKFFLLARYNGIAVPRGLKAGQAIKVPGKPLPEPVPPKLIPEPVAARSPEEPSRRKTKMGVDDSQARNAYEECKRLIKTGDNDRAYDRCREAASLSPRTPEYQADTEHLRTQLVQLYDRKAREAYRRQDLDECVSSWDKVLQLDPNNEPADRERDRCIRLRDTINSVKTN
jgi:tetratricopeptide (TPR) repeat protein